MSQRARRLGKRLLSLPIMHVRCPNSRRSMEVSDQSVAMAEPQTAYGELRLTAEVVADIQIDLKVLEEADGEKAPPSGNKKDKKRRKMNPKTSRQEEDVELEKEERRARSEGDDMTLSHDGSSDSFESDSDEELDDKLREEVEKDIPPSISDLALAVHTTVRRVLIIWNPFAGNRKGKQVMTKAKKLLEKENIIVDTMMLERRGHAEEICEHYDLERGGKESGDEESGDHNAIDVLAAVGGDGTFHECVNGMMKRILANKRAVPLAMIAAGTGNSFLRELHVKNLKKCIYHIARGVNYPIDICKVRFGDGSECYAFNSLHWGLGSKVNVRAEKLRWMGSAIRYTTAALLELIKGGTTRAKITIVDRDGVERVFDEDWCLVIANNIITAAKGMKMAPDAKLDDGLIDLLLIRTDATLDLMQIFRKTYDGTHTELDYVEYLQVKSFSIEPYEVKSDGEEVEQIEEIVDVDGELKGITPFSCEVLPRALRVIL